MSPDSSLTVELNWDLVTGTAITFDGDYFHTEQTSPLCSVFVELVELDMCLQTFRQVFLKFLRRPQWPMTCLLKCVKGWIKLMVFCNLEIFSYRMLHTKCRNKWLIQFTGLGIWFCAFCCSNFNRRYQSQNISRGRYLEDRMLDSLNWSMGRSDEAACLNSLSVSETLHAAPFYFVFILCCQKSR